MQRKKYQSVEEYFKDFLGKQLVALRSIRTTLQEAIPQAKEVISYNMPAFAYQGILVYYAAYPKHVGFYPTPSAIHAFQDRLSDFKHDKGSIQFPYDKELPLALIADMARFRWEEQKKEIEGR